MQALQSNNDNFLFVLGHEPLLSAAEIFSYLKLSKKLGKRFELKSPFLIADSDIEDGMINKLGGTVKIAKILGEKLDEEKMLRIIEMDLENYDGKKTFGLSVHTEDGKKLAGEWGKQLKKKLKTKDFSVRYVFKNEATLSSVSVEKNKLLGKDGAEYIIGKNLDQLFLAKTISVQPFESFSSRDYGRPGRDAFSGMLPPKLAMMMINLAESDLSDTILDPFCGSGTILTESLLRGFKKLVGSDLSKKAVDDTLLNLDSAENINVFQCDATEIDNKLESQSIDAIITEPYLGKPMRGRETKPELEQEANNLLELYKKAFLAFKKIIRPGGRVVIVIPRFSLGNSWITFSDSLLPSIKAIGFQPDKLLPDAKDDFLLYHRPKQFVGREIWRFISS